MKRKIMMMSALVLMSVMIISLVSANWFTDIFNRGPPSINSRGTQYSPSSFGLADLAQGVPLRANLWMGPYTWTDKDVSIKDAVSGLTSLKYIYSYSLDGRTLGYWYPGRSNSYESFQKGNYYYIMTSTAETWKYVEYTKYTFDAQNCDAFKVSFLKSGYPTESYYMRANRIREDSAVMRTLTDIDYWAGSSWETIASDRYPSKRVAKGNVDFVISGIDKDNKVVTMYTDREDVFFDNMCTGVPTSSSGGGSSGGGSSTSGGVTVYTKDEIDAKLGSVSGVTYQGVLDMFGEGKMIEVEGPEPTLDCVSVCHQNSLQCAFGEIFVYADDIFTGYPPEWMSHNLACEDSVQSIEFYETFSSSEKLLRCLCLPLPN